GALFGGGWVGLGVIEDLDRGIVDRMLVSPLRRGALVSGLLIPLGIVTAVQSLVVVGVGVLRGASLTGGVVGLLGLLLSAMLLAAPFGALSSALAVTIRQQESVVGLTQFLLMPLTFTATAFMPRELLPGWIQGLSRANPVDWSVSAAREGMMPTPDWGYVVIRLGALLGFTLVAAWIAMAALRRYQHRA
ncbi:MAG TPA: ABC transporter permease, partial [Euzebya sp.]|nr:ABC transporter permease [Euzebya sp.]